MHVRLQTGQVLAVCAMNRPEDESFACLMWKPSLSGVRKACKQDRLAGSA